MHGRGEDTGNNVGGGRVTNTEDNQKREAFLVECK